MGVALNEVVAVGLNAIALKTLLKLCGSRLTIVVSDDNRSYHESAILKFAAKAEYILVVGNAQVGAFLVFLNVGSADYDDDLNAVANFLKHAQLAVGQESRQYAACVVVVEEFTAELEVKFTIKL